MTWAWLALVPASQPVPGGTLARADVVVVRSRAGAAGHAGVLAAWPAGRRPHPDAVRGDAAAFDPDGAAAQVSLLLLDRDHAPLFDDPAVTGAVRRVLAGPAPAVVTTLVRDAVHLAGAAWVVRGGFPRLDDDPFARFGPTLHLDVGPGLFATRPPVPGPVGQRYSGQPWPVAGFLP